MRYLKTGLEAPLTYVSSGFFTAETEWAHSMRIIDSYEIIWVVKGPVYIEQDNCSHTLNDGDVLLLFPGLVHNGFASSKKGTSFYWVHFLCPSQEEMLSSEEALRMLELVRNNPYYNGLDKCLLLPEVLPAPALDRLAVLFRQLLHLSQSGYYTGYSVHYALTGLLIELSQQHLTGALQAPAGDRLQNILEWLRIHESGNISLKDAAHAFNYTREYLARYFKKRMGMTITEYLLRMKLAKARDLLCRTDKSIREIAQELGYPDEKYFMRLFKRYEHTTASHFRDAYRRTHLNNS